MLEHQRMVSLELLSSLDGLIWLQSGQQVGVALQQHQTTVSRNQRKCAQAFRLTIEKERGRWRIRGDTTLLQMERRVHQRARLEGKGRLRLETSHWLADGRGRTIPERWWAGASRLQNSTRSLVLLRERIIDALLCPPQNVDANDSTLAVFPLHSSSPPDGDDVALVLQSDMTAHPASRDLLQALRHSPRPQTGRRIGGPRPARQSPRSPAASAGRVRSRSGQSLR